jgi:hypothetical protein
MNGAAICRALAALLCCGLVAVPGNAAADDGFYVPSRWLRTTPQLPMQVNDNTVVEWKKPLEAAVNAWNRSDSIDSPLLRGFADSEKCSGVSGTIQICSTALGRNGWMGVARIVVAGEHVAYGVAKLNDSYFEDGAVDEAQRRQWILCRQLGHIYGLTLRPRDGADQPPSSCMQQAARGVWATAPDDTDMQTVASQYAELDRFANDVGNSFRDAAGGLNEPEIIEKPKYWGKAVHYDVEGRPDIFERLITPSRKAVTMVIWANDTKKPTRP